MPFSPPGKFRLIGGDDPLMRPIQLIEVLISDKAGDRFRISAADEVIMEEAQGLQMDGRIDRNPIGEAIPEMADLSLA